MTEILTNTIVDCSTNTTQVIPLTEEEIVAHQEAAALAEQELLRIEAETQAKAAAKASGIAKLLALGLTEEEANALVK